MEHHESRADPPAHAQPCCMEPLCTQLHRAHALTPSGTKHAGAHLASTSSKASKYWALSWHTQGSHRHPILTSPLTLPVHPAYYVATSEI